MMGKWQYHPYLLFSFRVLGGALAGLVLGVTLSMAQEVPPDYPDSFERVGRIDAIHPQGRQVVVGDVGYGVVYKAPIHLPDQPRGTMRQLSAGMTVGFDQEGENEISELWVLPPSHPATWPSRE